MTLKDPSSGMIVLIALARGQHGPEFPPLLEHMKQIINSGFAFLLCVVRQQLWQELYSLTYKLFQSLKETFYHPFNNTNPDFNASPETNM